MDLELEGKTAFVPGASRGLGRAVAARLAAEGANVTIASRDREEIDEAAAWIVSEADVPADRLRAVTCDVTDAADVRRAVEGTVDAFGGLDVQVNNHGGPPAVTFDEADDDQWDAAYRNVIVSNVRLARAGLAHLAAGDGGSLVVITSASVREPPENQALSNVFRLGLYGLAKTIAREYAPAVRTNCVTPRFIMTERIEYKLAANAEHRDRPVDEVMADRVERVPLARPGDPAEFADAVAFVASPRSSYTTGSVVRVDGGWTRGVL